MSEGLEDHSIHNHKLEKMISIGVKNKMVFTRIRVIKFCELDKTEGVKN